MDIHGAAAADAEAPDGIGFEVVARNDRRPRLDHARGRRRDGRLEASARQQALVGAVLPHDDRVPSRR